MRHQIAFCLYVITFIGVGPTAVHSDEPKPRPVTRAELGGGVVLETGYIPPGEFMMGSTAEEKLWATGIEGGAQAGTARESYEGEQPRRMQVKYGFWMGRTEVTVGQFRRFVEETGYVTDAEKPDGKTQCFNSTGKNIGGRKMQSDTFSATHFSAIDPFPIPHEARSSKIPSIGSSQCRSAKERCSRGQWRQPSSGLVGA